MVVTVGDATGTRFEHVKGSRAPDQVGAIYSASKLVSGVAIMGAVAAGQLSLDDLASQCVQSSRD